MLSAPSEGESLAAVERRLSLAIEQEYRLAYLEGIQPWLLCTLKSNVTFLQKLKDFLMQYDMRVMTALFHSKNYM